MIIKVVETMVYELDLDDLTIPNAIDSSNAQDVFQWCCDKGLMDFSDGVLGDTVVTLEE